LRRNRSWRQRTPADPGRIACRATRTPRAPLALAVRFDGVANDNGRPLAWAPVVLLRGVSAHVPVEVSVEGTFACADGMNIINSSAPGTEDIAQLLAMPQPVQIRSTR
jgi:hypothetical protein